LEYQLHIYVPCHVDAVKQEHLFECEITNGIIQLVLHCDGNKVLTEVRFLYQFTLTVHPGCLPLTVYPG